MREAASRSDEFMQAGPFPLTSHLRMQFKSTTLHYYTRGFVYNEHQAHIVYFISHYSHIKLKSNLKRQGTPRVTACLTSYLMRCIFKRCETVCANCPLSSRGICTVITSPSSTSSDVIVHEHYSNKII